MNINRLHPVMNSILRAFSVRNSLIFATAAVCLFPRPLEAQIGPAGPGNNYYPQTNAPVDGDLALAFIESLLHEQYRAVVDSTGVPAITGQKVYNIFVPSLLVPDSQSTPLPPPTPGDDNKSQYHTTPSHYILANDAELDVALGAGVQKILDGTATFGGSVGDLVSSLAKYKKATIKTFVKTATTNILNYSFTGPTAEADRTARLEELTEAACAAEPAQAASIVAAMLPLVVPKVKGGLTGVLNHPDPKIEFGPAQKARTESALGAVSLQNALNSIPGIKSKGGVTVTQTGLGGVDLTLTFGTSSASIANFATAGLSDLQNALNNFGLNGYGAFTVATDALNTLPAAQNDYVISFTPRIYNIAGGTNRDTTPAYADAADEVVRKAIEKAAINSVAIVNSALGVVMQGVDVSGDSTHTPISNGTALKAKELALGVSATAINTAYASGFGYLFDEVAIAVGTKIKAASYLHKPSDLNKKPIALAADVSQAVFTGTNYSIKDIALIGAGLMKGFKGSIFEGSTGGTFVDSELPEKNVVDGIKAALPSLSSGDQNYLDNVQYGFQSAYGATLPTNAASVGRKVLDTIATDLAYNNIAARLTGAAAWLPGLLTAKSAPLSGVTFTGPSGGNFIAELLQTDADHSGNNSISDIIEAAVRASSSTASTVANLATVWSKNATAAPGLENYRLGQISKGAALGLKGQPLYNAMLGTVVSKVLAGRGALTADKTVTTIKTLPTGPNPTLASTTAPNTKTLVVADTTGIIVGQFVTGTNIPDGSVVSSINTGTNTITISKSIVAGVTSGATISFRTPLKTAITLTELGPIAASDVKEITSFALTGAVEAGHTTAVANVALTVAKAASGLYQFYRPILQAAIDDTIGGAGAALPVAEQWRAVLATMAAKKLTASVEFDGTYGTDTLTGKPIGNMQPLLALIPAYAATVTDYDSANTLPINKGGALIDNIQKYPKQVFNRAFDAFVDPTVAASAVATKAAITAVGLTSPTSVTLAAALAIKERPTESDSFQTEAIGLNPALSDKVKVAVATARHVADGTSDLFDYLDQTITQNPKFLSEIVTAATVVAPSYAHIVAHAVGFRAPSTVAAQVPLLFNYAHITSADTTVSAPLNGQYDNLVDATSAMTAAITAGILEAKTGYVSGNSIATKATVEITNLKNAVVALVKQAVNLTGNTPVNSQWLTGSNQYLSNGVSGGDTIAGGGEGLNNFMQYDPEENGIPAHLTFNSGTSMWEGSFSRQTQKGAAGVITAFVAQALKPTDTTLPGNSTGLIGTVISAAVGVVKADVSKILAIAQAAEQAARLIPGSTFAGETDLVRSILNTFIVKVGGVPYAIDDPSLAAIAAHPNHVTKALLANGKPNPYYQLDQKVINAVEFGRLAAQNNIPGAGAAGIINYTLFNVSGSPVTDIFGL